MFIFLNPLPPFDLVFLSLGGHDGCFYCLVKVYGLLGPASSRPVGHQRACVVQSGWGRVVGLRGAPPPVRPYLRTVQEGLRRVVPGGSGSAVEVTPGFSMFSVARLPGGAGACVLRVPFVDWPVFLIPILRNRGTER